MSVEIHHTFFRIRDSIIRIGNGPDQIPILIKSNVIRRTDTANLDDLVTQVFEPGPFMIAQSAFRISSLIQGFVYIISRYADDFLEHLNSQGKVLFTEF